MKKDVPWHIPTPRAGTYHSLSNVYAPKEIVKFFIAQTPEPSPTSLLPAPGS